MDFAPCNGVIEKEGDDLPSKEEIDHIVQFFLSRKAPFIWWTSNKNLENFGFQYGGILTGIALDTSNKELPTPMLPGLIIQPVQSEERIRTFSNVAVDALGMPSHTAEPFTKVNIETMKAQEQVHLLASLNGTPVGTITLSTNEHSAGIWSLATLPKYRKSGIGKALIVAALNEAKKQGHNEVMAILMPKGMAWGIFTQLGFSEVTQFPFYVFGVAADELELED